MYQERLQSYTKNHKNQKIIKEILHYKNFTFMFIFYIPGTNQPTFIFYTFGTFIIWNKEKNLVHFRKVDNP